MGLVMQQSTSANFAQNIFFYIFEFLVKKRLTGAAGTGGTWVHLPLLKILSKNPSR